MAILHENLKYKVFAMLYNYDLYLRWNQHTYLSHLCVIIDNVKFNNIIPIYSLSFGLERERESVCVCVCVCVQVCVCV